MKHIIPSIFNILELVEADQYECFLVILEKLIQSPFYKEMKELPNVFIIPLGKAVEEVLEFMINKNLIRKEQCTTSHCKLLFGNLDKSMLHSEISVFNKGLYPMLKHSNE